MLSAPTKFETQVLLWESTAIPHQAPCSPPPVTGLPLIGVPVGLSEIRPSPASVPGGSKLLVVNELPCESNAIRPGPSNPPWV